MKKCVLIAALALGGMFASASAEAAVACGPRGCVAGRPYYRPAPRVYVRPAPRVYVAPRRVAHCYWRGGVRVCR